VESLDLGVYNICLINCNEIFANNISDDIINDLHMFNILDRSVNNVDVKKIAYHYIILGFSEAILNSTNRNKHILFFNNTQLPECSMLKFYDEFDVINLINTVLNRMKRILPIKIYISKYSLSYFDHLLRSKNGKGSMLLNDIQKPEKDFAEFTFSKAKAFSKKYDLKWLNNNYFNRLSTKFLLIK